MTKTGAMLLILLGAASAPASAEGFALAGKAGSTGLGAELTLRLTDSLNLRLGAGGYSYGYDSEVSGIDYNLDLKLANGTAALDWHPGGGAFRLSGGLLLHGNKLEGLAVPTGTVTIGDTTYQANQIGTLTAVADYERSVAPFAMIGAGNGARGGRLFFSLDLGVAFCGQPKISVAASRNTFGLQDDLEAEAREIQDDLTWLKAYPIVAIGIGIRF